MPTVTTGALDALKARFCCKSDRELGRVMGWSAAQVSTWRTERTNFADDAVIQVSTALEIDPVFLFLAVSWERTNCADLRAAIGAAVEASGALQSLDLAGLWGRRSGARAAGAAAVTA